MDEIALKKGHGQFETIIYTETEILQTMCGKKSNDLQTLLKQIPGIGKVTHVCIDMCASFSDAEHKALPHEEIVLDRFHIVKLLNKKLDKLRIKLYSKLDKAKQERFKSVRFLLFRDRKEFSTSEKRLLKEYLQFSSEMKEIYWLTQDFKIILLHSAGQQRADVSNRLMNWCDRARKHLKKFVKTLESWWDGLVNACLYSLNNGHAEGVNNKIKLVKRMGYGFRNRLNFKLKIQAACNP